MKRRDLLSAGALALLAGPAGTHALATPGKRTLESGGAKRSYYLFVPETVAGGGAPLLMLLHGSGQNGLQVLRAWLDLATAQRFILAAPDSLDSMFWHLREDGPAFLRDVVDSIVLDHPVDQRRLYLFGLSGGAVHALTLAMLESEYFAATAVFAGAWRDERNYALVPHARRKIPVAIFVGDRDELFPLEIVRATRRALEQGGHPVQLTILQRRGHSYPRVAARVNSSAWDFMSAIELDREPLFQRYPTG